MGNEQITAEKRKNYLGRLALVLLVGGAVAIGFLFHSGDSSSDSVDVSPQISLPPNFTPEPGSSYLMVGSEPNYSGGAVMEVHFTPTPEPNRPTQ